jgi:hypothetical protein
MSFDANASVLRQRIEATLDEKIKSPRKLSLTSKLRPLLPKIERALQAGLSHDEIIEAFTSNGLIINRRTYETILYRLRKRKRA